MIICTVASQIPKELDSETLSEKFQETAPMYQDTKGLIRKNYICDLDKLIDGGIYWFESTECADMWFDEARIKWLTGAYSSPKIEYFENRVIADNVATQIIT